MLRPFIEIFKKLKTPGQQTSTVDKIGPDDAVIEFLIRRTLDDVSSITDDIDGLAFLGIGADGDQRSGDEHRGEKR